MDFIVGRENVVFLGPPGTGKTHLAIGLGVRACQAGHRVAFATAAEWVDRLAAAHQAGNLAAELTRLGRYPLIVVDKVGYIPIESEAANLFFQLISNRYERASVIVTSNNPFGRWGEVFGDETFPRRSRSRRPRAGPWDGGQRRRPSRPHRGRHALTTTDFLIRLATGALIGVERQWRARMAGLRKARCLAWRTGTTETASGRSYAPPVSGTRQGSPWAFSFGALARQDAGRPDTASDRTTRRGSRTAAVCGGRGEGGKGCHPRGRGRAGHGGIRVSPG
ncbi:ATP-binding protein [Streptomyces sp. NPDC056160]|uniref:ATP-binding protein n=1 Tax=Streptomyces sp. NPDC056160 TaxID=3345731 RepID=UPI0035E03132